MMAYLEAYHGDEFGGEEGEVSEGVGAKANEKEAATVVNLKGASWACWPSAGVVVVVDAAVASAGGFADMAVAD